MRHAAQGDEQGARRVEKVGAQLELYSVEHPGELQFQVGEARVACVVAALGLGAEARGSGGEPDQSARQSARGAAPPPPRCGGTGPGGRYHVEKMARKKTVVNTTVRVTAMRSWRKLPRAATCWAESEARSWLHGNNCDGRVIAKRRRRLLRGAAALQPGTS